MPWSVSHFFVILLVWHSDFPARLGLKAGSTAWLLVASGLEN
jgi:hypothetical protein